MREQKGSHIAEAVIFRLQGFPDDGRCGKAGLEKGEIMVQLLINTMIYLFFLILSAGGVFYSLLLGMEEFSRLIKGESADIFFMILCALGALIIIIGGVAAAAIIFYL